MNVVKSAAPLEPVKASESSDNGKTTAVTAKSKGKDSFANILNSTVEPVSKDNQQSKPADQPNEDTKFLNPVPKDTITALGQILAFPLAMTTISTNAQGNLPNNDTNVSTTPASTVMLDAVQQPISQDVANFNAERQNVLNQNADILPLITSDKNQTLLKADVGQAQTNLNNAQAIVVPRSSVEQSANPKSTIKQQNFVSDTTNSPESPVNEVQDIQDGVRQNLKPIVDLVSKTTAEGDLLKPLTAAAATVQQPVSGLVKSEANNEIHTEEDAHTLNVDTNAGKVIPGSILSQKSSENQNQQFNSSVLTPNQNLDNTNVVENGTDRSVLTFHHVLNQVSKADQTSDVVNQPQIQPSNDNNNIVAQIVEHARLIKSPEVSEMVIKLKPEHLGELTLKVAVDNGVVNATFHSNNSEVRSVIEASVQQLKNEMAQQGLKVEYVGVYAGLGQPFSNGQGEANRQQAWKQQLSKKQQSVERFSENVESIASITNGISDTGVDYRI